jgi:antirestriction protein ArdC
MKKGTRKMSATVRADIYQTITDRIIAAIEAGAGDWKMPWHVTGGGTAVSPGTPFTRGRCALTLRNGADTDLRK